MKLAEKAAYIKGLIDGLKPEDNDTNRILLAVVDLLSEMTEAIEEIDDAVNDLDEYVGELDEDLQAVEEYLEEEEEFCCGCGDDDYFTITCPKCGEEFAIDEDIAEEGKINCPGCGEELTFDLADEEE